MTAAELTAAACPARPKAAATEAQRVAFRRSFPGDESFGEGAGSMLRYAGEVDRTAFLAFLYELAPGD